MAEPGISSVVAADLAPAEAERILIEEPALAG